MTWLLDTVIYTGALIAAVLVLRRPVARLLGPQTAYALWALPFLRLLLPPIMLPASMAPEAGPAVAAAQQPVVLVMTTSEPVLPSLSWPMMALIVWVAGALAFIAWRVVTYRWMREDLLEDSRTVGEVGKVRLVETPAVDSPVAFGVLDKVVALPLLFMAQPDRAARDLAIAHELEHHRGRDLAANFAAQALLALHWFNPLAWLAWRAMRRDQEAACDARVLAGKGREERARYAELIAGTAAGRRLALAAPMACPVLGDASIIHRLRSLTMSDISPRRRWTGRALVAAGALALPLTASFSYAAAQAQDVPPPSAPPAPPAAVAPPAPPAPEVKEKRRVERFVERRAGTGPRARREGRDTVIRRFALRRDGDSSAAPPPWPQLRFNFEGSPADPEFQKRMEDYARQMDEWSRKYGKQWEKWGKELGERYSREAERFARVRPGPLPRLAIAPRAPLAPRPPIAPEALRRCDSENSASDVTLPDGRRQVIVCNRVVGDNALSGLRSARDRIANDARLGEDVRRDVLQDLDEEIARLQRDGEE